MGMYGRVGQGCSVCSISTSLEFKLQSYFEKTTIIKKAESGKEKKLSVRIILIKGRKKIKCQ
jgi:hypothetical protein